MKLPQLNIRVLIYTILGFFGYIVLTSFLFQDQFRSSIFLFHIDNIYPYFLIMSIILFLFTLLLLYRLVNDGHTSLLILSFGILLSSLSYLFGYLNFDPTGTINFRHTRLFQLQVLSQSLSVFLFYLHYELNSYTRPRTGLLSMVLLLFWPHSILKIYYFMTNSYPETTFFELYELISLVMLQIGVIIIFTWLLVNALSLSARFLEHSDRRAHYLVSLQLSGIILLFLGVIFQLIENLSPIDIWHTPINTIAILLIGLPYFLDPQILLFAPIRILLFGVIDESGRTHYFNAVDPNYQDEETLNTTSELFGGLTLAFSSIGKEVARTEQGIDSLQFSDRTLIVEYLSPYYLIVLANRSTFFLEKEMEEYLESLTKKYPTTPKDRSVIPESVFDELNHQFFPVISTITTEE